MASGPITSWQIDGERVETVADFISGGSKITEDSDCSHDIKRGLLLRRRAMTNLDSILKSRDITFLTKAHKVKAMAFSVVMFGCESWAPKNWCFWTVVLEKKDSSESPWTARRSVNPKRNQSWIFTERTDVEAEALTLWPPDVKSQFIRKDPDAGKDWRQEEKGTTEDEMVGWHHWLNRHEFEQTLRDDGQGSLVCYSPWGHKESDTTEQLNWLTDGTSASGPRSYSSLISVDRSCWPWDEGGREMQSTPQRAELQDSKDITRESLSRLDNPVPSWTRFINKCSLFPIMGMSKNYSINHDRKMGCFGRQWNSSWLYC